jgi:hypothetical protein
MPIKLILLMYCPPLLIKRKFCFYTAGYDATTNIPCYWIGSTRTDLPN